MAALADPTVHTAGIGTRAFGMAGNFTALAGDFSALFWNPAGLAFIPVREVHCAMELDRQNARTDLNGQAVPAFYPRVRINSAGLMRSVPTVRGGFGFALGFSSPWFLDDLNDFAGIDIYKGAVNLGGDLDTLRAGDTLFYDRYHHRSTGQCNLWNAGIGWQIAPGLAMGFSIGLLTGSQNMEIIAVSHTRRAAFENLDIRIEREYLGYDARIGFLYAPSKTFSAGCRLDLPRRAKAAENSGAIDYLLSAGDTAASAFGVLQSGFSGALGAALQMPYMTVSSDIRFRSPISNAPRGSHWKAGAGIGAEVPLRRLASVIRCGYSWSELDLSSMQIKWDEGGVEAPEPLMVLRNEHLFTAGYSLFLGSTVSLELAYGYCFWKFSTSDPAWQSAITEQHTLQRGMMTISIRY
jgi:hypothetical protein